MGIDICFVEDTVFTRHFWGMVYDKLFIFGYLTHDFKIKNKSRDMKIIKINEQKD